MNEIVKVVDNDIIIKEDLIQEFINFKKLKDAMDLKEKEFKQLLKDAMEKTGRKTIIVNGLSANLKSAYTKTSLDSKRLKEEMPDIFEDYSKKVDVQSSVVLTIEG